MARFAWVPFYDSDWVNYVCHENLRQVGKLLPFIDGHAPKRGHENVSWQDIANRDILFLAAHGRKWKTNNVAWVQENGKIAQWTAKQFAQELCNRLAGSAGLQLDYRLLACFGANNITPLAKSFGAKLAKEMSSRNMRGTLTAYKGATGMSDLAGSQVGSSRVTCALSIMRHWGMKAGKKTLDSAEVWEL